MRVLQPNRWRLFVAMDEAVVVKVVEEARVQWLVLESMRSRSYLLLQASYLSCRLVEHLIDQFY